MRSPDFWVKSRPSNDLHDYETMSAPTFPVGAKLFERPAQSYDLDPSVVGGILSDPASPLHQMARLIPDGSKVLDVGAGNGIFAQILARTKPRVEVDGIEPNSGAADVARSHYRRFFHGAAENFHTEIGVGKYDYLVLADVVEHLVDPVLFVTSLRPLLKKEGKILLSTPNVAFASVRIALLNGDFDYVDSGILERTHLRFFTYSTLLRLISAVGMHPERICFLERNPFATEIPIAQYSIGIADLVRLMRDDLASVYQFLVVLNQLPADTQLECYGSRGNAFIAKYCLKRLLRVVRRPK